MTKRYQIQGKIAEGGLGTVYRAHDANLNREVALKRVRPEILAAGGSTAEDLVKEARLLSALQHPNIVTVYDVGIDDEGTFVVMEYLVGETLDKTIKRSALTFDDFSRVTTQCLEGLIAAHAKGLVHRDLKPSNIMVIWHASGKFQIKILDFGLAKFGEAPSVQTADQEDGIMGSIYFMAPEQFERKALDARTDLYALAANLYFTLTAQYPFQGNNAPQVMASHLTHRYHPLTKLRPDLKPWVGQWLDWMMSRLMENRPESAKVALQHFRKESPGLPPTAAPSAPTPPPATPPGGVTLSAGVPTATPAPAAPAAPATPGAPTPAAPAPAPPPAPAPSVVTPVASHAPTKLLIAAQQHEKEQQEAAATPAAAPAAAGGEAAPKLRAGGLQTRVEVTPPAGGEAATGQLQPGTPTAAADDGEPVLEALPEEPAPPRKNFFATIPKWAYITVPILLILVGGLAIKRQIKVSRLAAEKARMEALLNQDEPTGGPPEVAMLVEHLRKSPDSDQGIAAATVLSKMVGDGVEEAIAGALPNLSGIGKVNLINAIAMRECEPAVPNLLQAAGSEEEKARRAAFNALGFTAESSDVPAMIEALDKLEDDRDRDFATNAITSVCERIVNEQSRTRHVLSALSTVTQPRTKNALLKIVGQLGGDAAFGRIKGLLDDPDRKLDAARALGEWQTSEPLPILLDFIKKNEGDPERIVALQSMAMVASRPSPFPHKETTTILSEAFGMAPRSREQQGILMALSQLPGSDASAALQKLTEEGRFQGMRAPLTEQQQKAGAKIVKVAGETTLSPGKAVMLGQGAAVGDDLISNWRGLDSHIRWELEVTAPGSYAVSIDQSCESEKPGVYRLLVGGETLGGQPQVTGSDQTFKTINLGTTKFKEAGNYNLWIVPIKITDSLFNVRSVKLTPK